jgi:hypothetical protein
MTFENGQIAAGSAEPAMLLQCGPSAGNVKINPCQLPILFD